MATDHDPVNRAEPPDRLNDFLRHVLFAFRDENRSDVELLERFTNGDQEAFRALVGRYGRSVWAVCLAMLGDAHHAEDVFQAAFVALARSARTVDARHGVGAWLRSAARNAARMVRRKCRQEARRLDGLRDRLASETLGSATTDHQPGDESHTWILAAEELEALPQRLREAVVMYHLEGRTLTQLAEMLGCSVTEAHRRVNRGLEVLRARLSARGVALTAGLLAAIPIGLASSTAKAAVAVTRNLLLPSPRVAALVDAIVAPRFPSWLVAAGVVVLLAAGTAIALVAYPAPKSPPIADAELNSKPVEVVAEKSAKDAGRPTAALTGRVTDSQGKPVSGASVSALVRRPWAPGDRGLRDDVVAKVVTDADGSYSIAVPADFATHYPERSVTLLVSGSSIPTTTKLVPLHAGNVDVGIPATRSVRGTLVGLDGKPAAGVKVGVVRLGNAAAEPVQGQEWKLPDGWPADVVSGADGVFTIAGLPAGEDVWVEVRDERFAMSTVYFKASESNPVQVKLTAPRVIEGRVTASDTGKPLAGVRVSAFAGPRDGHSDRITAVNTTADAAAVAPPNEFDTISGPDGTFRFRLPHTDPYLITVQPPDGTHYLGWRYAVWWKDYPASRGLRIELPVGRIVRGVMKDDAGQLIVGGWVIYRPVCGSQGWPKGLPMGRDVPARTAADGSFSLAVPLGSYELEGWGPTPDYRPALHDTKLCPVCAKDHGRGFEHALEELKPGSLESVALTLHRREGVRVGVVDPEGKPVASGVALCRSVVRPLRSLVPQPLLVRAGAFELPGCVPGRVYPVAFFDSERQLGAVAEVRVGDKPQVKLEQCGAVEMRLVGTGRRPLAGVQATAFLLLNCDRPAALPNSDVGEWGVDQSWFNPKHHLPRPVTDTDGKVTLQALIPNADYMVYFLVDNKVYSTSVFRVAPGRTTQLPDMIAILGQHPSSMPMDESLP